MVRGRTSSTSTMVRGMSMTTMRGGETMGRTTRPATKAEDRPIHDAQWRKEKAEEVIAWLMSHGYDAFVSLFLSFSVCCVLLCLSSSSSHFS